MIKEIRTPYSSSQILLIACPLPVKGRNILNRRIVHRIEFAILGKSLYDPPVLSPEFINLRGSLRGDIGAVSSPLLIHQVQKIRIRTGKTVNIRNVPRCRAREGLPAGHRALFPVGHGRVGIIGKLVPGAISPEIAGKFHTYPESRRFLLICRVVRAVAKSIHHYGFMIFKRLTGAYAVQGIRAGVFSVYAS